MGVAEFENVMAEYARAGGTRDTDQEMKDDLLHILPGELREVLLWNSKDGGPFHVFRDMVTTQATKIFMNQQKFPIHYFFGQEDAAYPARSNAGRQGQCFRVYGGRLHRSFPEARPRWEQGEGSVEA